MHPLEQLRSQLRGRVIEPGDPDYDQARTVFYGGEERHPAAIARVASAEDVARVVTFTREMGLELAVRSGRHSVARHSVVDGGIVLDLGAMKGLEIQFQCCHRAEVRGKGAGLTDPRTVAL